MYIILSLKNSFCYQLKIIPCFSGSPLEWAKKKNEVTLLTNIKTLEGALELTLVKATLLPKAVTKTLTPILNGKCSSSHAAGCVHLALIRRRRQGPGYRDGKKLALLGACSQQSCGLGAPNRSPQGLGRIEGPEEHVLGTWRVAGVVEERGGWTSQLLSTCPP